MDAYPLQWPVGRQRTPPHARRYGNLNKMPAGRIRQVLHDELRKMDVTNVVISSNVAIRRDGLPYAGQRPPDDPGVVLYFTRKGTDIAISCDAWSSFDANLRAIGLTIEAIRGMERWGTEEMIDRAFTGFKALPEAIILGESTARSWHEVLEVSPSCSIEVAEAAFKRLARIYHPDAGGTQQEFIELKKAWEQAKEALRA